MRRIDLAVAVGAHQQQPLDRLLAQHEVEEADGGAPGPLQVIGEHHHRPFPRRDRAQHRHRRPLRPPLRGQRIARLGRHRQQRRELRHRRGHQPRVRPHLGQDPLADLGQLVLRLGQQQPAQRPESLINRVELQIPPVGVELARHEPAIPAGHHRPQLIGQRRLAHPGRPAYQHSAAPARQRVLKRVPQRRHLAVAARQPRRRQQPQRDIMLANADRSRRRSRRPACLGVPHLLQVIQHPVGALVPVVRLLLQQVRDDRRQDRRDRRVHLHRRDRHPRQVIVGQPQRVPGPERRRARGQLVQRRAERVQVGPLIHRPAGPPGRLRCQVRQRPGDLAVVSELRADLAQRRRQREVHQARRAVAGDHDVRRGDVPVHHPQAVHPRHRCGQLHRQAGQVAGRQRLGQSRQGPAAGVRQHDRPGEPRRVRQLHDPDGAAEPLQHRRLVPQPAFAVRAQRLLADDRVPGQEQPGDARPLALVHYLGPDGRIPVRRHTACPHGHLHAPSHPRHTLPTPNRGQMRVFIRPSAKPAGRWDAGGRIFLLALP